MDLKQTLEKELGRYGFIRLEALHRLITAESVRAYLNERSLDVGTADLQDITAKSPKLFAILVLLGRGNTIKQYLSKIFMTKIFRSRTKRIYLT